MKEVSINLEKYIIRKFEELLKLNVNDKVEKKKSGKTELTYLSWAFAVAEMEKAYPEWEYSILEFNGLPYQFDSNTGYLVWTEIKAGGKTKKMWLPVMDGSNKAMKNVAQEYLVKGWNDAPPTKKTVEAATMFDINKTIMRCLVKNIAMFGIGLYIYSGEDLPEEPTEIVKIETIDSEQGIEIVNLAKIKGVDVAKICEAYKINLIIDLPLNKFEKVIATLKNRPDVVIKDEVKNGNN
jgi:hypothetical protein